MLALNNSLIYYVSFQEADFYAAVKNNEELASLGGRAVLLRDRVWMGLVLIVVSIVGYIIRACFFSEAHQKNAGGSIITSAIVTGAVFSILSSIFLIPIASGINRLTHQQSY